VEENICFDFPVDVFAPNGRANLDPRNTQLDIVQWSLKKHGTPLRYQGSPLVIEEPPDISNLPIDLIMDQKANGIGLFHLYHTARLSGTFVNTLILAGAKCKINVDMLPTIDHSATKPDIEIPDSVLAPVLVNDINMWGWTGPKVGEGEYIYTLHCPLHANQDFKGEEIYRVVIRWSFWLPDLNGGDDIRQPYGGYEDALHFSVRS
jgi:hypothetical protein